MMTEGTNLLVLKIYLDELKKTEKYPIRWSL